MANINLLPWREWERERKRKEFLVNIAGMLIIALLVVLGAGQYLDRSLDNQTARNSYYEREIKQLETKIAEIDNLKKEREELLARMQIIQDLQGNRPVIVRVFDELVQTLSKGVHYLSLERTGTAFAVIGQAESNNRISALMRNLENSDWFASPNLKSINEVDDGSIYGEGASDFDLTFVQENPNSKDSEDE